jgi:LemA protein
MVDRKVAWRAPDVIDAGMLAERAPSMLRRGTKHGVHLRLPRTRATLPYSGCMSLEIGVWVAGAVLLFWTVGAYNRLVALRNAIVRGFDAIDAACLERRTLLDRQVDAACAVLVQASPRLEALRAANRQLEAARAHARAHPGAKGAIASLKLAEDVLAEARARVPMATAAGSEIAALSARIAEHDTALEFARRQFNAAVSTYNAAVRQVPTRLIAAVFGFSTAGTL